MFQVNLCIIQYNCSHDPSESFRPLLTFEEIAWFYPWKLDHIVTSFDFKHCYFWCDAWQETYVLTGDASDFMRALSAPVMHYTFHRLWKPRGASLPTVNNERTTRTNNLRPAVLPSMTIPRHRSSAPSASSSGDCILFLRRLVVLSTQQQRFFIAYATLEREMSAPVLKAGPSPRTRCTTPNPSVARISDYVF